MVSIEVQNFGGCSRAEIALERIALIAGHNAQGKSSICTAAGAALAREWQVRGIKKGDAGQLVRSGSGEAKATAADEDGSATVVWPGARVSTQGAPPQCSHVAAGLQNPAELPPMELAEILRRVMKADPSQADFLEALDGLLPTATADKVWSAIQRDGWDAAYQQADNRAKEAKGAWREYAREPYGSRKADGWQPEGWRDELADATESALDEAVVAAEKALEAAVAASALDGDARHRLQELSDSMPAKADQVQKTTATLRAARDDKERAQLKRQNIRESLGAGGHSCPHCGADVAIRNLPDGRVMLVPWDAGASKEEATANRDAADAADAELQAAHDAAVAAEVEYRQAVQEHKDAAEARQKILQSAGGEAGGSTDVDGARDRMQQARTDREMWRAWRGATQAAKRVDTYTALAGHLGVQGVRAEVMRRKLNELNADLREICTAAGWQVAEVGDGFTAYWNGRPLVMCSESERWRAAAALQIAIARRDGSPAVILDRADVLDGAGRSGLIKMLLKIGVPALVAMTANGPDKVPDLAAKGAGCTYWLEAGSLSAVGAGQEKAA